MTTKAFTINNSTLSVDVEWTADEDGKWNFDCLFTNTSNNCEQDDSIRNIICLTSQVQQVLEGQQLGSISQDIINEVRSFIINIYNNQPNFPAEESYYGI